MRTWLVIPPVSLADYSTSLDLIWPLTGQSHQALGVKPTDSTMTGSTGTAPWAANGEHWRRPGEVVSATRGCRLTSAIFERDPCQYSGASHAVSGALFDMLFVTPTRSPQELTI